MASTKVVSFESKTVEVDTKTGKETKFVFVQILTSILEMTPQKSDTETFLAHAIREKFDTLNGQTHIEMEEAEIEFLQAGIKRLRDEGRIAGSDMYYAVKPLRDAEDKKEWERKQKKAEEKK